MVGNSPVGQKIWKLEIYENLTNNKGTTRIFKNEYRAYKFAMHYKPNSPKFTLLQKTNT